MSVTRIFRRRAALLEQGLNDGTAVMDGPLLKKGSKPKKIDARKLFVERYDVIRPALECHREQGVIVFAIDQEESAVGHVWMRASLDKTRAATVGRHTMCSMVLPPDYKEISLRHLVIMVRAISHTEVRVRVIDLHTSTAFADEEARVMQAVSTEGPMFLSVGRVKLIVMPTEGDLPIPESAEDAYACLPERVFMDERPGTAGHRERRADAMLPQVRGPGATLVRSKLGPLAAAGDLIKDDEKPRGTLTVRAGGGPVRRPVGETSLERGVLIGRYARCDVGATYDEDSRLSRVHLLILADGDDIIAIDTASTNGSLIAKRSFLLEKMTDGLVLDLAGELEVSWHDA